LQREAITAWHAQHPEFDEIGWFEEDEARSGGTALGDRPKGRELLEAVKAGTVQAVVCYKHDRMHRELADGATTFKFFREHEVPVFSTKEGEIKSYLLAMIQVLIGEQEKENIGTRSRDMTRIKAAEVRRDTTTGEVTGTRWLGGITPFGYRIEPHEHAVQGKQLSGWLVPDDELLNGLRWSAAQVVREAFRLSAEEGRTNWWIADHLNDLGIPTSYARQDREYVYKARRKKVAGRWGAGAVRRILTNPVYKGYHEYGKRNPKLERMYTEAKQRAMVEGKPAPKKNVKPKEKPIPRQAPPLVSAEAWEAAQLTQRRNQTWAGHGAHNEYLLRGLLRCGYCGRTFVGTTDKGHTWYRCQGHYRTKLAAAEAPCPALFIDWDLDTAVWNDVVALYGRDDIITTEWERRARHDKGKAAELGRQVAALDRVIRDKDAERAPILRTLRKGNISDEEAEAQLAEVEREKATFEAQRHELTQRLITVELGLTDDVKAFARHVAERVRQPDLSFAEKRRIVEAVIAPSAVVTVLEPVVVKKVRRRTRRGYAKVEIAFRIGVGKTYQSKHSDWTFGSVITPWERAAVAAAPAGSLPPFDDLTAGQLVQDPDPAAVRAMVDAVAPAPEGTAEPRQDGEPVDPLTKGSSPPPA
jgi:site-specific DNA recombinase